MTINQSVLTSLPAASTGHVEASLLVQDPASEPGKAKEGTDKAEQSGGADAASLITWNFLINPSQLNYSRKANYTPSGTLNSNAPVMQFFSTDALVLKIDDVLLESWHDGRSLQPLLDGLNKLLEAKIDQGKFAPPVLSFVWGSKRFGPCVLLDISYNETAWLSGDPASVILNLTLQQLPPEIERENNPLFAPDLLVQNTDDGMQPDESAEGAEPRMPLTERQANDVRLMTAKYLMQNSELWKPEVQREIEILGELGLYRQISVSEDGVATFISTESGPLAILRSNGDFSDASGVVDTSLSSSIVAAGQTVPSLHPADLLD